MRLCGKTDVGKVRQQNEDFWTFDPPHLVMIADGMGGHAAGEIASGMAARSVKLFLQDTDDIDEMVLANAIRQANREIYQTARSNESYSGMGTTMILCYEKDDAIHWAHVGDSRLYIYRQGMLHQITQDHSFVGELERSGQITSEEAKVHPKRNLLTRAVGAEAEIEIDTGTILPEQNDLLLLCTDGLTNMVTEAEIATLIDAHLDSLDEAVTQLIDTANAYGGNDNITVVLASKESADQRYNGENKEVAR